MLERNQPTPTPSLTDVPYNINLLDAHLSLFPDFLTLNENNEVFYIPSLLLDNFMVSYGQEITEDTAWLIYLHRYVPNELIEKLEYNDMINHIDILVELLKFIVSDYDRELMQPHRQFPRLDYIRGMFSLMRARIDIQFHRMQTLHDRTLWPKTNNNTLRALKQAIKQTQDDIESTKATVQTLLETYEAVLGEEISNEFKFTYYQTNLEILLFKIVINPGMNQAELKSLGTTSYMDKLEALLPSITDFSYHLHFFLYQSRIASTIDRDTARAKEYAALAKQKLMDYTQTSETPLNDSDMLHNNIALVNLMLRSKAIAGANKAQQRELLCGMTEDLLIAKNSIKNASDGSKKEFTTSIKMVLDGGLMLLKNEILFITLDRIDPWIAFLEKLNTLIPLFAEVKLTTDLGVSESLSMLYEKSIADNINILKKLKSDLHIEAEKNEKELDGLNKLSEAYLSNFESMVADLLKELNVKTNENIKQRKIAKHSKPTPPTEKKPSVHVRTPETVGKNTEGAELNSIEEKLKIIHKPDEAEILLYAGDRYLRQGRIEDALIAYEEAFKQTHLQIAPNKGVIKAIKLQLWHTNNALQAHIQRIEIEKKKLDMKREHFIITLGIRAMTKEKVPAKELNLRNQTCWENIYKRGYAIFADIGKNKENQGLPKSKQTLQREKMEADLKKLHGWRDMAATLVSALAKDVNTVNFPPLSSNPASLFKTETGENATPKKPAAAKPKGKPNHQTPGKKKRR